MAKLRQVAELLAEAYLVSRPAMGLVASTLYLYDNDSASLWMALYFAFVFQLGCNAGNDYMDWERDVAQPDREVSISRGKAKKKSSLWWYYTVATVISLLIMPLSNPFFGVQYFLLTEIVGQWWYNGIFLGMPLNKISFIKKYGSPLDFLVGSWTYMPFPHIVAIGSYFPTATISAWGTTMLWAQLKDYNYEKDTKVNTTATAVGPTGSRLIMTLAVIVMVQGDWRFAIYGLYTLYRCWYPVLSPYSKPVGKMSVIMALNLAGIVALDPIVDPMVKFPVLGLQLACVIIYKTKLFAALEQKYYAIHGILNRHKPYDPSVWKEENAQVLLWKVGACGRSASAVMTLFSFDMARLCLMGFIVFRTQDTWADLCLDGSDARIEGLQDLPEHLQRLQQGKGKERANAKQTNSSTAVTWDLTSRPRNRMYVDITENVHRFDEIFQSLPELHRSILLEYAIALGNGWGELERCKDDPATPQLMRQHAAVALDAGFFGMCRAMSPELLAAIEPTPVLPDTATREAYVALSDFMWYMNLVATIEQDVEEGVALDEELRAMKGVQPEVIQRVRVRWLVSGLKHLQHAETFLVHPALIQSWMLRVFTLQMMLVSINECNKQLLQAMDDAPNLQIKSGGKVLSRALRQSCTVDRYRGSIQQSIASAKDLLESFVAIQVKLEGKKS